jgi:predicted RNA-binding protein with RPS1 domain
VLSVGDKISVFVKDFDRAKKRISLGYRRPEDDPYRDIEARFPVGAIVRGVVVRMFPFGAFINIAPEVDALCHISQISNYHLNKPGDVLVEGMEVDARVVEVSDEARRISVSIREVEPINPEPDSELVLQQQEQQRRQSQAGGRRRGGKRRDGQDDLPTSYVDDQARSAISEMAEITTVTKEGSDLLDSMAALRDELQAAEEEAVEEKAEKPEAEAEVEASVEEAVEVEAEKPEAAESVEEPVEEEADKPEAEESPEEPVEEPVEEAVEEEAPAEPVEDAPVAISEPLPSAVLELEEEAEEAPEPVSEEAVPEEEAEAAPEPEPEAEEAEDAAEEEPVTLEEGE